MTAASSSAQQLTDPWDLPVPPTSSKRRAPVVVPDSWDDDDDDEEPESDEPLAERNKRIWDDANMKAPAPMPAVISNASSHPVLSPPPGAFQPTMRILKRPTGNLDPNSGSATPPTSSTTPDGFREREAKYQAARHRIFGPESGEESASNTKVYVNSNSKDSRSSKRQDKEQKRGTTSGPVNIIRDPRGPTMSSFDSSVPDDLSNMRGFQRQRAKTATVGSMHKAELDVTKKDGI